MSSSSSSVSSSFQTIQSWDQVTPFAGRIVAYQTSSYYIGATKWLTEGNTRFGFIEEVPLRWERNEKGYLMIRVLKPQDSHGNCALIDSQLKEQLCMRIATTAEVELIDKAIAAKEAKFEYAVEDEIVRSIFEKHRSKI